VKRPSRPVLMTLLATSLTSVIVAGACTDERPPAALAPAIRFVDVPTAFVFPTDDVDPERAGLQVNITVAVEAKEGQDVGAITVTGPTGSVEANVSDGAATAIITLPSAPSPGVTVKVSASVDVDGAAVSASRDVVARDAAEPVVPDAPPAPVVCSISVASDGDADVACSGGEPSPSAMGVAKGGLIQVAVHPNGPNDDDSDDVRRIQQELRGGEATVPFPFQARGSGRYRYDVTLSGSVGLGDSATQSVVVGTDADVVIDP